MCTIVGVALSIYFYSTSKKERELTYYVHSSKSTILKNGQATGLKVLYKDKEIGSDVTGAQISIWNQGSESIRKENILKEFEIVTTPRVPILEATAQKGSREVIGVSLDQSRLSEGIVPISWKILEHNDGTVVQLIYAGPPDVDIQLVGTIEGQIAGPSAYKDQTTFEWMIPSANLVGYAVIALVLFLTRKKFKRFRVLRVILALFAFFICAMSLIHLTLLFTHSGVVTRPYGI